MTGSCLEGQGHQPAGLNTRVAQPARVWNYLMGGKDNFAADRDVGHMIARMFPGIIDVARLQRRFLVGTVRFLAHQAGVRQFLDIGVGLPVAASTHQVAQQVARQSRVVYVDNDPLVLIHARALLTSAYGGVSHLDADVRDPGEIMCQAARRLDFSQPVAVMMLGILGEIPDADDPAAIVTRLLDPLPPGSYLALSDGTDASPALNQAITAYNRIAASPYHLRSTGQLAGYFSGLALTSPGTVGLPAGSSGVPGGQRRELPVFCGVGRKG